MAEWGIDIQKQESEKIDKYLNKGINIVITVCDNAKIPALISQMEKLSYIGVLKTLFMVGMIMKRI